MNTTAEHAVRQLAHGLEKAWNAGDAEAFAALFTDDADYVIVDGHYIQGRPTITAGHRQLFEGIYRGSANQGTVEQVRFLTPEVAIAHVRWELQFTPPGAPPQSATARCTLVCTGSGGEWLIAAFQNTPIVTRPDFPNAEHVAAAARA